MRLQIGNDEGVCAVDVVSETLLGAVATDTVGGFTVSAAALRNFQVGQVIDLVVMADGTTGAGALGRTVTSVNSATNTVTYSGAELTLDTTYGAYLTGQWELASPVAGNGNKPNGNDPYANVNGGPSVYQGFDQPSFGSITAMRARLTAINSTTYSSTELDKMSYNDLVYAIRVNDAPGSISDGYL